MDPDETILFTYLNSWPGDFVSCQQICRQADGRRRFQQDSRWALVPLNRLVDKGLVETDGAGRYRVPVERKVDKKPAPWISPHIKNLLERNGKLPDS